MERHRISLIKIKEHIQFKESLDYTTNESMEVTRTSMKASTFMRASGRQNFKEIVAHQQMREVKNQSTWKELQPKEYPFLDSDVPAIIDELLTKKVIALSASKRPEESNKVDDYIYFKFHCIIGHHITICFTMKENITLVQEGKIIIDDVG